MFFPPTPSPCYALPSSLHTAMVESCFARGDEPWTRRAVAGADAQRFAPGDGATARLRLTCQRLESAFRKACEGLAALPTEQGGLTDDERQDWTAFGATYLAVREAAFRVLRLRATAGSADAASRGFAHAATTTLPADGVPARRAQDRVGARAGERVGLWAERAPGWS